MSNLIRLLPLAKSTFPSRGRQGGPGDPAPTRSSKAYREEKAPIAAFLRKYRRLLYSGPLTHTQALYANAYYLEDKTMEQVAEEYEVTLPTVQRAVKTAKSKLLALMEKEKERGNL